MVERSTAEEFSSGGEWLVGGEWLNALQPRNYRQVVNGWAGGEWLNALQPWDCLSLTSGWAGIGRARCAVLPHHTRAYLTHHIRAHIRAHTRAHIRLGLRLSQFEPTHRPLGKKTEPIYLGACFLTLRREKGR